MPASPHATFRFALFGFAVTAAFVTYQLLVDLQSPHFPNPTLMVGFVILCPPSLLSIAFFNAEVGTGSYYFAWAFIGILNAALYAAVRALIGARWKKSA